MILTVQYTPISTNYRHVLVLEQLYLLNDAYNLNTIRVANNPSGSNALALYMYNRDMTILYHSSHKQIKFIKQLNIHHTTFTKHITKGT